MNTDTESNKKTNIEELEYPKEQNKIRKNFTAIIQNKFFKVVFIVFLMILFMFLSAFISAIVDLFIPSLGKIFRGVIYTTFMGIYFYGMNWILSKIPKIKRKNKQQNFGDLSEWINSGTEGELYYYLDNLTSELNYRNDYMSNMRAISKKLSKQSIGNQRLLLADLLSKEKNDTYINIIIVAIAGFVSNGAIWYLKYGYDNLKNAKDSFVSPTFDYFIDIISVFFFLVLLLIHTVKLNYEISNKNRLFIEIIKIHLEKKDK